MRTYPYIYGCPSISEIPHNTNNIDRLYAVLPPLPNKVTARFEFTEAPRTVRKIKGHIYAGMKLPESITMDHLVETVEVYPDRHKEFDTTSPFYHKINCIKVFRAVTGCGLTEARGCIEAFENQKAHIHFYYHDEILGLT
jgi:hypothetical protein